ncbi:zinc ribbon domain-containing protein [Oceanobacillus sp. CF4.6]|uniref:zinc ribbon domain-containing protein n=1 Tax=Oceanobacillus sp. CF4.6 TaxID=3373080 RepID=UPI003EE733C7
MKFCKECGSSLKEDALFCKECGNPVVAASESKLIEQKESAPEPQLVPKQPMSKKTKMMWISIGAVVVLFFGLHTFMNTLLSKERLIDGFQTALIEGNAEEIADYLTSNDKQLEIDKDAVAGLLRYFEEHPDEINPLVTSLNEQSQLLDQSNHAMAVDSWSESNLIKLQPDSKLLFYDRYSLVIEPVYLTVETNYKDTVLSIDEEEIGTADSPDYSSTFGPYVPGYHSVKAAWSTDFIDLEKEEKILLMPENGTESIGMYLEADQVTVQMPATDGNAKLFINGNDVGINLYENPTFGPVLTDGSMTLAVEVELPWGTVKMDEQPIESDYVELNMMNEELQTVLMDTANEYNQQMIQAVTSVDSSELNVATKSLQDSTLEEATYAMENGQALEIEYLGSVYDLDSIRLYKEEDSWTAGMSLDLTGNFTSYDIDYPEYADTEESWSMEYELQYDEKAEGWLVSSHESGWGMDSENVKEYTVDEPVIHKSNWIDENIASATTTVEGSDAGEFVLQFRDAYENSLNSKDFSLIESYLKVDSHAYDELEEYVGNLKDTAYTYEFTANEVMDTKEIDDSTIEVTTNEIFVFTNHLDEQIDYDRNKVYNVTITDGGYKITKIDYVETNRD